MEDGVDDVADVVDGDHGAVFDFDDGEGEVERPAHDAGGFFGAGEFDAEFAGGVAEDDLAAGFLGFEEAVVGGDLGHGDVGAAEVVFRFPRDARGGRGGRGGFGGGFFCRVGRLACALGGPWQEEEGGEQDAEQRPQGKGGG